MKLTCLSQGSGFHCPPTHILQLGGFRLLLECPIDLSALAAFSPVPPASPSGLLRALPWYKTVPGLCLWEPSLIDAVLISSPSGMLGLPFLTCNAKFSAKIYLTEAAARIGRLMMEDLVAMHAELVRFYGADSRPGFPEWTKWEELEKLSPALRQVILGEGGVELGSWMPLYSAADIKECMQKIHPLRYGEETYFNGSIMLKAYSSGLDIGSCNWTIKSTRRAIAYISGSIFLPACWKGFDYLSLLGNDVVLFSDLSSLGSINNTSTEMQGTKDYNMTGDNDLSPRTDSTLRFDAEDETSLHLLIPDESFDEFEKIKFICTCIRDSLTTGGSVLIPTGRIEIIMLLLEQISESLETFNMKVPIFVISCTAEETLALLNSVPEWLSNQRQQKLFAGEMLFQHMELKKAKRLFVFSSIYSSELPVRWQEPCIVFSSHWSLRLGSVVPLLHRWHADPKSLLILEQGVDVEMALLPFRPVAIRVLQCSFLSGIVMKKVQPLLETLQSKLVLFPKDLRAQYPVKERNFKCLYYCENVQLRVPSSSQNFEVRLETDLAFQLQPRRLAQQNLAIARLKGRVSLSKGKYFLSNSETPLESENKQRLHWGSVEPTRLLLALQEKGLVGTLHWNQDAACSVISIEVTNPKKAVIEIGPGQATISCEDENIANLIYEALNSVCDGL